MFQRSTLVVGTRTIGAVNLLICALIELRSLVEAEALGRGTLEKLRHVLGRDHCSALMIPANNLTLSLPGQGKDDGGAEI